MEHKQTPTFTLESSFQYTLDGVEHSTAYENSFEIPNEYPPSQVAEQVSATLHFLTGEVEELALKEVLSQHQGNPDAVTEISKSFRNDGISVIDDRNGEYIDVWNGWEYKEEEPEEV